MAHKKIPNYRLNDCGLVIHNQNDFIKYFKLKECASIKSLYTTGDMIAITCRGKLSYAHRVGREYDVHIDSDKFRIWRENLSLLQFLKQNS